MAFFTSKLLIVVSIISIGCALGNVKHVLQHEAGILMPYQKEFDVIMTFGLGPCVGVAGLDKNNGIAFVIHFDDLTDISTSIGATLLGISYLNRYPNISYEIIITGGHQGKSEGLINSIKRYLTWYFSESSSSATITEKYTNNLGGSRSIGVNIKTKEFIFDFPKLEVGQEVVARLDRFIEYILLNLYEKTTVQFV